LVTGKAWETVRGGGIYYSYPSFINLCVAIHPECPVRSDFVVVVVDGNMAAVAMCDTGGVTYDENGELAVFMEEDDFAESGTDCDDDEAVDYDECFAQSRGSDFPEPPPYGPDMALPLGFLDEGTGHESGDEGAGEAVEDAESGLGHAGDEDDDEEEASPAPPPPFRPKDIKEHLIAYVALDLETTSSQRPPSGDICSIGAMFAGWGVGSPTTPAGEDHEGFNVIIDPGLPDYSWGAINVETHGMTAATNRGKTKPKDALIQLNAYLEDVTCQVEEMYRTLNPHSPPLLCEICVITHNGKGVC